MRYRVTIETELDCYPAGLHLILSRGADKNGHPIWDGHGEVVLIEDIPEPLTDRQKLDKCVEFIRYWGLHARNDYELTAHRIDDEAPALLKEIGEYD